MRQRVQGCFPNPERSAPPRRAKADVAATCLNYIDSLDAPPPDVPTPLPEFAGLNVVGDFPPLGAAATPAAVWPARASHPPAAPAPPAASVPVHPILPVSHAPAHGTSFAARCMSDPSTASPPPTVHLDARDDSLRRLARQQVDNERASKDSSPARTPSPPHGGAFLRAVPADTGAAAHSPPLPLVAVAAPGVSAGGASVLGAAPSRF